MIGFEVLARDGAARRGRLLTAHGAVDTPAFMPVGTAAAVKAMTSASTGRANRTLISGDLGLLDVKNA
jgi:queuine tRNA-ribosyltransferase